MLVIRPVVAGATSGRLRGLRTREGTASSSSSSSSSVIRTSRRCFGALLLSAGSVSAGDGSATSGLFPATLSSVVGAGRGGPVPPHCWCIEHTEQRRLLAGLPPRGSPCQVPVICTVHTGQRLQSAAKKDKSTTRRTSTQKAKSVRNITLGAGRPSLKACIRSPLRTKLLSAKLNSSFNSYCTSVFSKTSGLILVGSWLPAYLYAECTLFWQGITR